MLSQSQRKVIVELQDYLTRIAVNMHHTHWQQVPADEILGEMNLAISERAEQDPTFLQQSPGYITRAAAWDARAYLRHTYTRYLHGERISKDVSLQTEIDEELPVDEVYPAAPQPDNDLALDIRTALAGLDEVSQQVAAMKMQGLKRVEIARALGFTSQALTTYLRRIEAALAPVWAALHDDGEPASQLSFGF